MEGKRNPTRCPSSNSLLHLTPHLHPQFSTSIVAIEALAFANGLLVLFIFPLYLLR